MSFPDRRSDLSANWQINLLKKLLRKGETMHEVKVFDASGNLKKVISIKALNKRTEKQISSPSFYNKKGRKVKPLAQEDPK